MEQKKRITVQEEPTIRIVKRKVEVEKNGRVWYEGVWQQRVKKSTYVSIAKDYPANVLEKEEYIWVDIPVMKED